MEDKTREGRIKRMSKEVLGYLQTVAGKMKFLVQFEDGQKGDTSYVSLSYVCSKE